MANIDSCLDLVTCQYPELHTRLLDIENSLANLILQLILDGCRADKIKLYFELLSDFINSFLFVDRS